MQFVQQYFRATDLHGSNDDKNDAPEVTPADADLAQDAPAEEVVEEEQPVEEQKDDEIADEEVLQPENAGPIEDEEHEDYQKDELEDEERSASFEPYDPKNIMEIDVKTNAKVKGLKKYILDKIEMFKKVQILLYKKNE